MHYKYIGVIIPQYWEVHFFQQIPSITYILYPIIHIPTNPNSSILYYRF